MTRNKAKRTWRESSSYSAAGFKEIENKSTMTITPLHHIQEDEDDEHDFH